MRRPVLQGVFWASWHTLVLVGVGYIGFGMGASAKQWKDCQQNSLGQSQKDQLLPNPSRNRACSDPCDFYSRFAQLESIRRVEAMEGGEPLVTCPSGVAHPKSEKDNEQCKRGRKGDISQEATFFRVESRQITKASDDEADNGQPQCLFEAHEKPPVGQLCGLATAAYCQWGFAFSCRVHGLFFALKPTFNGSQFA